MRTNLLTAAAFSLIGVWTFAAAQAADIAVSSLDLTKVQQAWGEARANKSVDQNPITIAGKTFEHGVGTHAESVVRIELNGSAEKFTAKVGVDDECVKPPQADAKADPRAGEARVEFILIGDGKTLVQSGAMKAGDAAKPIEADLHGVKELLLVVEARQDTVNFCHADWADATIAAGDAAAVKTTDVPHETATILTPAEAKEPKITGPKVFGVRPGHEILFTASATGDKPMKFDAEGLPDGATFDGATGRIGGTVSKAGDYKIALRATNALGKSERELKLVVGPTVALTPPMGWNSWNCFAGAVSDEKVRAAADAMVSSGLIDHGWTYINIDDCWQGDHTKDGVIRSNKKFPDMKALTDYIHGKGLKAGIYSSPGPKTCAGFTGSFKHEVQDVQTWAGWGFDYIKYDWCSYGGVAPKNPNLADMKRPYEVLQQALHASNRDIVFSLCQYGMGDVWNWGGQVDGNCWRTTGDINDSWGSMSNIGFGQAGREVNAKPGNWNDPDMLVVGQVGWGPQLHPTRLTPNEQYTHISLWSLLSAPLLIGCDMTQMDDFTKSLLTNDEVIAISQDPLGKQAGRVARDGMMEVWAKDLEDGGKAVGIFNRGRGELTGTVDLGALGVSGKRIVRDVWKNRDIGTLETKFETPVPPHGVVLVTVREAK